MGVADVNLGNHAADGGPHGAVGNGFFQCLQGGHQLGRCLGGRCCGSLLQVAAFSSFDSLIFRPGNNALFQEGCFQAVIYGGSAVTVGRSRCLGGGGDLAPEGRCLGFVLGGVDFEELVSRIDYGAHVRGGGNQIS